jgi:hypothetical protein
MIERCRMCEIKLLAESNDGLCTMCHVTLCQDKPYNCERCKKAAMVLLKWNKKEENGKL